MNIRRSIIGAVLAGASLVGVAGMANEAHAAEPLAGWPSRTDQAPRQGQATTNIVIKNCTGSTLVLDGAWTAGMDTKLKPEGVLHTEGPLWPDDSVPPNGAKLETGETWSFEVTDPWSIHEIALQISSDQRTDDDNPFMITMGGEGSIVVRTVYYNLGIQFRGVVLGDGLV